MLAVNDKEKNERELRKALEEDRRKYGGEEERKKRAAERAVEIKAKQQEREEAERDIQNEIKKR